ncbi:MAG: tRNA 2-thiouridine(34) synthase MnmA [Nanoarchaeota archaeon]
MKLRKINNKTVLIGFSGGVDSSVAALLLKKQGYKVIGAFLKMYSDTKNPLTGECSYLDDLKMAKKSALKLNIPLIELDYENEYKKNVIGPMFSAYKKGLTPNPDILCNKIIKFPFLWREAEKIGAKYIATGHYARINEGKEGYSLLAGRDKSKDQSYFLAALSQEDLRHSLFPVGNLKKQEVRRIAKSHGLPNWNKHGTVGICFVGQIPMQKFLQQKIKPRKGKVMMVDGEVIGAHSGISFYTIGQKVGSNIGIDIIKPQLLAQKRFYIASKKKPNILLVAPEGYSALSKKEVKIKDFHLINTRYKIPKSKVAARIRHLGNLHAGRLIKKNKKYYFVFSKPVQALAEGQYIVLYKGERVIGSGEIRLR